MTPKFDNLASLLMEMPRSRKVDYNEVATYIKKFPEVAYTEIARAFGVSEETVVYIAKKLDVERGKGSNISLHKGKETHVRRILSDVQEEEILDHWLANHNKMTFVDLAKWVKQQFNVVMDRSTVRKMVIRVAAKHNKPLPELPRGMRPMKRTASKHRNEPGTGKLPTQSSQHFSGSTDIVPSNPKHGGPAHPPK